MDIRDIQGVRKAEFSQIRADKMCKIDQISCVFHLDGIQTQARVQFTQLYRQCALPAMLGGLTERCADTSQKGYTDYQSESRNHMASATVNLLLEI